MKCIPVLLGLALLAAPTVAQSPPSFEAQILPILEDKCFRCHQATRVDDEGKLRKPKGGLRLDGRAWIERGGEGGAVLSAGHPDDSEIVVLISLDHDDPDIMPSKGEPLSDEQIALIAEWVRSGASFGDWKGASLDDAGEVTTARPAPIPSRIQTWSALAEGLEAVPSSQLEKATGDLAQARPVIAGGPLLRVGFASNEAAVDDKAIARLTPLRRHIVELDLDRCRVNSRAFNEIARMKNLTRLSLARAEIDPSHLRRLAKLQHLEVLNLYGTAADDAALDAIADIDSLQRVYLAGTKVTERGLAKLRKARPQLQIQAGLKLPEAETRTTPEPRRRRS